MKSEMEDGEQKITSALLKQKSGEFDLESIHTLYLGSLNISELGCIGECIGLERLDLSNNKIQRLYSLSSLSIVVNLDLSANRVENVDALQTLEKLRTLNLAGNLIPNLSALQGLFGLENLVELRLKDDVLELSNPVCSSSTYKQDISMSFPKLEVLDGERLSGHGKDLYDLFNALDKDLESSPQRTSIGKNTSSFLPVNNDYWLKGKNERAVDQAIEDAEKTLHELLAIDPRVQLPIASK